MTKSNHGPRRVRGGLLQAPRQGGERLCDVVATAPSVVAAWSAVSILDSRQQLEALSLVAVGAGAVIGSWWIAVPAAGVIALPCAWEALVSAGPERRRNIAAGLALAASAPVLGSLLPLAVGAAVLAHPSTRAVVVAVRDGGAYWRAMRLIGRDGVTR